MVNKLVLNLPFWSYISSFCNTNKFKGDNQSLVMKLLRDVIPNVIIYMFIISMDFFNFNLDEVLSSIFLEATPNFFKFNSLLHVKFRSLL